MELKKLLNDKQYQAATYLDSHLRIIAGAGSGKTRVITYRIAHLIENIGIMPRNILAITFTNKAANEMKERITKLLDDHELGSTICTIHSLCVRVLRRHIGVLGYGTSFVIMDEEDQKSLIKKLLKEYYPKRKDVTVKNIINYISSYKTARIQPDRAFTLANNLPGEELKAKIYGYYEAYNQEHNMLDFDDLLIKTVEIFNKHPEIVDLWATRYQYVHVDEFQDVGEIEYELIHYFAKSSIVCVVGDPDQTIYSFRGSKVDYILNFDKDYPNVRTIILDQNYRSTKNILNVSNTLIRHNKNRLEKDLFSNLDEGEKIHHFSAQGENDEARYVLAKIKEIKEKDPSLTYKDFCILYRANYLSRPIEQVFIQEKIPYKIYGGLKFFNRKEVKDALSYLRLLVFQDDLAFERIINVPGRGIGEKTLDKIRLTAINHGLSDYEAIVYYLDEINISTTIKKRLQELIKHIELARVSNKNKEDVYEKLLKDIGYFDMLKKNEEANRIDNLMELKNSIMNYMKENPETATFENYLQDISLYTSQDEEADEDFVSMMSVHMSKGLEFNYVFVCGLVDAIFPSSHAIEDGGIEEERRLAYVAFTRAKKELYLTDSQGFSFVSHTEKSPSRFISELGEDYIEHKGANAKSNTSFTLNKQPATYDETADYRKGDLIVHDVFGKGVVIGQKGRMIDVAFSIPYGMKTLLANHPSIKKLTN